jgi:GTP-sensing pleiotropic transcriptional regulator CodY
MNNLEEIYNLVIKHFNENNIFGIFAMNKQTYIMYIPTISQLLSNTKINFSKTKDYILFDIRDIKNNIENIIAFNYIVFINPKYEKLWGEICMKAITILQKGQFLTYNDLEPIFVEVIKTSLKEEEPQEQEEEKVNINDFIEELTNTEKKAFNFIKQELVNGEGIISISKITDKTNISRPVYKNLFSKLEKAKIAEITNMGVKGTKIKFL